MSSPAPLHKPSVITLPYITTYIEPTVALITMIVVIPTSVAIANLLCAIVTFVYFESASFFTRWSPGNIHRILERFPSRLRAVILGLMNAIVTAFMLEMLMPLIVSVKNFGVGDQQQIATYFLVTVAVWSQIIRMYHGGTVLTHIWPSFMFLQGRVFNAFCAEYRRLEKDARRSRRLRYNTRSLMVESPSPVAIASIICVVIGLSYLSIFKIIQMIPCRRKHARGAESPSRISLTVFWVVILLIDFIAMVFGILLISILFPSRLGAVDTTLDYACLSASAIAWALFVSVFSQPAYANFGPIVICLHVLVAVVPLGGYVSRNVIKATALPRENVVLWTCIVFLFVAIFTRLVAESWSDRVVQNAVRAEDQTSYGTFNNTPALIEYDVESAFACTHGILVEDGVSPFTTSKNNTKRILGVKSMVSQRPVLLEPTTLHLETTTGTDANSIDFSPQQSSIVGSAVQVKPNEYDEDVTHVPHSPRSAVTAIFVSRHETTCEQGPNKVSDGEPQIERKDTSVGDSYTLTSASDKRDVATESSDEAYLISENAASRSDVDRDLTLEAGPTQHEPLTTRTASANIDGGLCLNLQEGEVTPSCNILPDSEDLASATNLTSLENDHRAQRRPGIFKQNQSRSRARNVSSDKASSLKGPGRVEKSSKVVLPKVAESKRTEVKSRRQERRSEPVGEQDESHVTSSRQRQVSAPVKSYGSTRQKRKFFPLVENAQGDVVVLQGRDVGEVGAHSVTQSTPGDWIE